MTNTPPQSTIYRSHTGTLLYRSLPIAAVGLPILFNGGRIDPAIFTATVVLTLVSLVYANIKLSGRADELRVLSDSHSDAATAGRETETTVLRLRCPGLLTSRWRKLDWRPSDRATLVSSNVRNAATAYALVLKPQGGTAIRLPLNGAALDLDALAAVAPEAIASFREKTVDAPIHYDLR